MDAEEEEGEDVQELQCSFTEPPTFITNVYLKVTINVTFDVYLTHVPLLCLRPRAPHGCIILLFFVVCEIEVSASLYEGLCLLKLYFVMRTCCELELDRTLYYINITTRNN